MELSYYLSHDIVQGPLKKWTNCSKLTMPKWGGLKCSECFNFIDLIEKANKQEDSLKRLAYVAAYGAARQFLQVHRTYKPFNPLLGETYELVTPKYRFIAE